MFGTSKRWRFRRKDKPLPSGVCSCCTDEKFVVGVGNESAFGIMLASPDTTGVYFARICSVSLGRNGMMGMGELAR